MISVYINRKLIFIKLVVLVILPILITVSVFAQEIKALTVSPVRLEVVGDPGQTIAKTIKLTNEQTETKTFYVSYENFTAQGETNKPEFTGGSDDLATWIVAPAQITLEPGREIKIPIAIQIPADVDPGDHFAAMFWGTAPSDMREGGQVAIGGRLGILVLLRVTGEINEQGQLVEFKGLDNRSIFDTLPITLIYRVQNTGNVRIKPEGTVTIINMFGQTIAQLPANLTESNALPKTIRKFEIVWNEETLASSEDKSGLKDKLIAQIRNFKLGQYQARLDATYGNHPQSFQARFSFWIIPWQLLGLTGVGLALLLFVFRLFLHKYTQRAVRKALEQHQPPQSTSKVD